MVGQIDRLWRRKPSHQRPGNRAANIKDQGDHPSGGLHYNSLAADPGGDLLQVHRARALPGGGAEFLTEGPFSHEPFFGRPWRAPKEEKRPNERLIPGATETDIAAMTRWVAP